MNLFDYSQINNFELGILISNKDNEYKEIINEVNIILNSINSKVDLTEIMEKNDFYSMCQLAREFEGKISYDKFVKLPEKIIHLNVKNYTKMDQLF